MTPSPRRPYLSWPHGEPSARTAATTSSAAAFIFGAFAVTVAASAVIVACVAHMWIRVDLDKALTR